MTAASEYSFRYVPSPIGRIRLVGRHGVLTGLHLADHPHCPPNQPGWSQDDAAYAEVAGQLEEYFAGTRQVFEVDLAFEGTPFQVEVWEALCEIPYGETVSYAALAEVVGRPAAVRAVGAANGRNPISIIAPCHRVIGANGSLTGYGWGVDRKAWLLDHERSPGGTLFAYADIGGGLTV
jgi:methylated-DNA-[protein]-cysteine S-methyltransferase